MWLFNLAFALGPAGALIRHFPILASHSHDVSLAAALTASFVLTYVVTYLCKRYRDRPDERRLQHTARRLRADLP